MRLPFYDLLHLPTPFPFSAVMIGGLNFGPWGTPINGATYGVNGTELTSPGCVLTVPHTQARLAAVCSYPRGIPTQALLRLPGYPQIVCNTSVGAGAGLVWFVTVDGESRESWICIRRFQWDSHVVFPCFALQASAPCLRRRTTGHPLSRASLACLRMRRRTAAMSCLSMGRSSQRRCVAARRPDSIRSEFALPPLLASQPYLGKISYGPSGTEFIAVGCTVTVPHSQIACTTAPGTGRQLRWLVTVGGQVSALSTATTSYAGPAITAVSPGNGPTAGGGVVTLSGVNFGTAYASSKLSIKINNDMQTRPAAWGSWVAALLAGQPSPAPAVDAWVAGLYSVPPLSEQRAGAVESVSFRVPPGYGPAAEIIVVVDGIPSQNISYTYDAPVITNLAPDRALDEGGEGCSTGL